MTTKQDKKQDKKLRKIAQAAVEKEIQDAVEEAIRILSPILNRIVEERMAELRTPALEAHHYAIAKTKKDKSHKRARQKHTRRHNTV